MIHLASVSFDYGAAPVLDAIDLRIPPGLMLLIGPNGCGKSTLLRLIAGVERPARGRITIEGSDLWREEVAARRHVVYVPEHADLTPYASLREVMELVCRLRGEPLRRAGEVLGQMSLSARAAASVRELSAGQRRRALMAAALIGQPHVALLDEPLELLDREVRGDVLDWVRRLVDRGAAVMVASHQVEPFLPTASSAITLRDGRLVGPVALAADLAIRFALVERLARGGTVAPPHPHAR